MKGHIFEVGPVTSNFERNFFIGNAKLYLRGVVRLFSVSGYFQFSLDLFVQNCIEITGEPYASQQVSAKGPAAVESGRLALKVSLPFLRVILSNRSALRENV